MDILIDFLLNNYVWFLVISLIIIFALIGYLVDITTKVKPQKKEIKPLIKVEDNSVHVHPSVEVYTNDNFDEPLMRE